MTSVKILLDEHVGRVFERNQYGTDGIENQLVDLGEWHDRFQE